MCFPTHEVSSAFCIQEPFFLVLGEKFHIGHSYRGLKIWSDFNRSQIKLNYHCQDINMNDCGVECHVYQQIKWIALKRMEGKTGNDFVFGWVMHYRRNLNSFLYHLTSITKNKKFSLWVIHWTLLHYSRHLLNGNSRSVALWIVWGCVEEKQSQDSLTGVRLHSRSSTI